MSSAIVTTLSIVVVSPRLGARSTYKRTHEPDNDADEVKDTRRVMVAW